MNGWDKALVEYSETGRIEVCPACKARTIRTHGYINGDRGSVDIKCSACGRFEHYDGFAQMHDHADPETITVFS